MTPEQALPAAARKVRLVIAEDHVLFRDGIVSLLAVADPTLEVVGQAGNGEEALRMIDRVQPDVALVDVRMPVMDGITLTRRLLESHPEVGVIILTMYQDEQTILDGIAAGARAYLLKDCSQEELLRTVHAVARGGAYLPANLLPRVLAEFRGLRQKLPSGNLNPQDILSRREMEVLESVVKGKSNKQIASSLHIDETTVKSHLHRIFDKLEVRDRTQAAVYALHQGWFSLAG